MNQVPIYPYNLEAVDKLVPYARNSRTHSDEQVAQIAASIREFGFINPVIVDDAGGIIAGHARVLAAKSLGLSSVPVLSVVHLTPVQRQAYLIADNKLTLNAGWDFDLLRVELSELGSHGFDLSVIGFSTEELTGLLETHSGLTDPDEVPAAPEHPVSALGDVWLLGKHRLVCGDCADVNPTSKKIGLIITSPPYNQKINQFSPSGMHKEGNWVSKVQKLAYFDAMPEDQYQDWQIALIGKWFELIREGGSIFYNHKNRYRGKQVVSPMKWLPGPFNLRQKVIWRRPGSVTQNARMFLPSDERIFWMYKGDDFTFDDSTEI